jgi:hypothetical protein
MLVVVDERGGGAGYCEGIRGTVALRVALGIWAGFRGMVALRVALERGASGCK